MERGERELGGKVRMRLRILAVLFVGWVVLAFLPYGWRFYIVWGGGGGGLGGRRGGWWGCDQKVMEQHSPPRLPRR